MGTLLIQIIFGIALCFAIFILCREIVLWYFKINKIIEEQKKTNLLLSKILIQLGGTLETKQKPTIEVEDISTHDYLDDQGKIRNVTAKTAERSGWTLIKK